jgi:hypothetical protein
MAWRYRMRRICSHGLAAAHQETNIPQSHIKILIIGCYVRGWPARRMIIQFVFQAGDFSETAYLT